MPGNSAERSAVEDRENFHAAGSELRRHEIAGRQTICTSPRMSAVTA